MAFRPIFVTAPAALLLSGVGAWLVINSQPKLDVVETTGPRHPVTAEMQKGVDAKAANVAPTFELTATDQTTWKLSDKLKNGPAFLYFILDGCPCSLDAEPLFHKLYANFKGKVEFAGAMPSDLAGARDWKNANKTPYALLSDPGARVAHSFGAERSVYCVLVDAKGNIDHMWAGYSASMLTEANERMAKLLGEPPKPLDTAYAPKTLSSGCSLTEGVGK